MFADFNDGQKTHVMEKQSVPFICTLGSCMLKQIIQAYN